MRTDYQSLTEQQAIELLDRVIGRAEKINVSTNHHITAFALRADQAPRLPRLFGKTLFRIATALNGKLN